MWYAVIYVGSLQLMHGSCISVDVKFSLRRHAQWTMTSSMPLWGQGTDYGIVNTDGQMQMACLRIYIWFVSETDWAAGCVYASHHHVSQYLIWICKPPPCFSVVVGLAVAYIRSLCCEGGIFYSQLLTAERNRPSLDYNVNVIHSRLWHLSWASI